MNQPEPWLLRLRDAFQAGYYQTEADIEYQSGWPWQGRICADCAFWTETADGTGFCRRHSEKRSGSAHTCTEYTEPPNPHTEGS